MTISRRSRLIRRGDKRTLDEACARGQDLPSLQPMPSAIGEEAQTLLVVGVPDPEEPAGVGFPRDQTDLFVIAITNHQAKGVDMAFEEAPKRQAAGADLSQKFA